MFPTENIKVKYVVIILNQGGDTSFVLQESPTSELHCGPYTSLPSNHSCHLPDVSLENSGTILKDYTSDFCMIYPIKYILCISNISASDVWYLNTCITFILDDNNNNNNFMTFFNAGIFTVCIAAFTDVYVAFSKNFQNTFISSSQRAGFSFVSAYCAELSNDFQCFDVSLLETGCYSSGVG